MRHTLFVVTLLTITPLTACIDITRVATPDDTTTADASDATTDTQPTMLRVVHASADLGPVDVFVTGESVPLVTGLDYSEVSEWLSVEPAEYVLEFRPAGNSEGEPLLFVSAAIEVQGEASYTMIAAGLLKDDGDSSLRVLPVREEWGTRLAARARVRLVHAGADAPGLTVRGLEGADATLDRFATSEEPGAAISTQGGDRLEFRDGDGLLAVFTAPPFVDGDEVLLVATGLLGSLARQKDGFALIAVGSEGALGLTRQDPQLFTVHGARDAPSLENCTGTGGTAVAANIAYGEVQTAFVSPGEYQFEVHAYPSGCTGPLNPGGTASGPLLAGERYMLLLSGEVTPASMEPGIQVAPFREQFTLDEDEAQVRFIHGASFTQIYIGNVTNGVIDAENVFTDPIAWRAESEEVRLAEGPYVLGAADAGGTFAPPLSPLVTFDVEAASGARAWGIVTGDPSEDDSDDKFLQLMVVNTAVPGWSVELVDVN